MNYDPRLLIVIDMLRMSSWQRKEKSQGAKPAIDLFLHPKPIKSWDRGRKP